MKLSNLVTCNCGLIVTANILKKHLKTKRHQLVLKTKVVLENID